MPARNNKQAERNAAKKEKKAAAAASEEPEPSSAAGGKLTSQAMRILKSSVMYQVAPHMVPILLDLKAELVDGKKPEAPAENDETNEPKEETNEGDETEVVPDFEIKKKDAGSLFDVLKERLFGANGLGLFPSSDATVKAFLQMKTLEFDGGPRSRRKGTPTLDRIMANVHDHMLQYVYAVFGFMVLRAFLFRSWFAFLPWLVFYQVVSVMLPLEKTAKIPVPLEKVPLTARVSVTVFLHGLVWFFFVYEFLIRTWWMEWFLIIGLVSGHAYVFRPVEA